MEKSFRRWLGSALPALAEGSVVAIDGKASRRSKMTGQQALHLVSAFAAQAVLVLGECNSPCHHAARFSEFLGELNTSTISVRLPDSLHQLAKDIASQDHISMNQFIASAVAEKISALTTESYLNVSSG